MNSPPSPDVPVFRRTRPPPPPAQVVPRDALMARSTRDAAPPLLVIQAPAGHGKTSFMLLLRQRLLAEGARTAWLTVAPADNDLTSFLDALIRAFVQVGANQAAIEVALQRDGPVAAILAGLEALGSGGTLFLDDFESINDDTVNDTIAFAVEHMPEDVRVVLASRSRPRIPMARLLLRQRAMLLSEADLRFDANESATFVRARRDDLSTDTVAAIHSLTQGWPGILQLICLTRQDAGAERFIGHAAAGDPQIREYVAKEMLQGLGAENQQFLLAVCVLERMDGQVCNALTGARDGAERLQALHEAGLPIAPVDESAQWFRLHPMFAQFLRRQLELEDPDRIVRLQRRAARWFIEAGELELGVHHCLAGGDVTGAARAMDQCASDLLRAARLRTLHEWGQALPDALVLEHPELTNAVCWSACFLRDPDTAERLVSALADQLDAHRGTPRQHDFLTVLRAVIVVTRDHLDALDATSERAMTAVKSRSSFEYGALMNCRAFALLGAGDLDGARATLVEALAVHQQQESMFGLGYTQALLGLIDFASGHANAAVQRLRTPISTTATSTAGGLWYGVTAAQLGAVLYQLGRLDEAKAVLSTSLPIIRQAAAPYWVAMAYVTLARLAAVESIGAHNAVLDEAEAFALQYRFPRVTAMLRWERVRQATLSGALAEATRLASRIEPSSAAERWMPPDGLIECDIAQVRLEMRNGRVAQALLRNATMSEHAARQGLVHRLLIHELLAAAGHDALGRADDAATHLLQALTLGHSSGVRQPFIDEGAAVLVLIVRLLEGRSGTSEVREFARALIAHMNGTAPDAGLDAANTLTPRECELIGLLVCGAPNKRIAAQIGVSQNTVKWHLRNLYEKLDVSNRTQAVNKARALGIIST